MPQSPNISDILEAGLRANSLRQQVTANNIANVNTPNFKRNAVKFEEILADKLQEPGKIDISEVASEIIAPDNTPVKANGNNVEMEIEVGQLMKTAGRSKAYIRLLSKRYSQIESAINTNG